MRTRDDAEYEKKREQIMEAALTVFAAKGYEKATNKDIAAAAGIGTPGLIYHYFEDKADLLRSCVLWKSPALEVLRQPDSLAGLEPREALHKAASAFMGTMSNPSAVDVLRVVMSESLRQSSVGEVWAKAIAGPGFRLLRSYFAAQMEAGTMRRMDPGAAVRCFVGPLLLYVLTHEVLPIDDSQTLAPQTMVDTLIDVFLRGMDYHP